MISWGFTKCSYLVGWTPVDPAALQPLLPQGFAPAPFAPYTMNGVGSGPNVLQETTTRTIQSPKGGPFAEFTPTKNGGIALWRGDSAWDGPLSQGVGTISPAPGSWAALVVGATTAPAQFHTGTWSFTNASLTLPPS